MRQSRTSSKMETKVVRENTLKLKFGAQSRNPSNDEVFAFFQKQGWDCDMLLAMYREDFCLFIKFQKEEQLKDALRDLGNVVTFEYANGLKIQVAVSAASGMFKYVRVFGLPPEVEDRAIAAVFAKYGSIQQMVRERYPAESGFPIWSGVRGINMEVLQEVPTNVYIQGVKARVFYDGIQHKCFLCGSTEHFKAECPKRKSVNERLGTYAHPPVNRTGLNDAAASSSSGSVVLPIHGKARGSIANPIGEGAPSVDTEDQFCGEMAVGDSKGDHEVSGIREKEDRKGLEEAQMAEDNQWQKVKRLRSRESNTGSTAKSVKVGDDQSPGLLKLQARRSRSLTSRQTASKGNGRDGFTGDLNQFPPLPKE